MSNLIVKSGHLVRKESPYYHLMRMPSFPLDEMSMDCVRYYKSETWLSPDYYPDAFPGPYGKSDAVSGVSAVLSAASWSGGGGGANCFADSLWGPRRPTGFAYTYCTATYGCLLCDTSRYAGFLATVKVNVSSAETSSGAGSRHVGVAAVSSLTPGLSSSDSMTISSTGYQSFTNVRLSDYLRISAWIDGNTPPDATYVYANGFPRVAVGVSYRVYVTITGV